METNWFKSNLIGIITVAIVVAGVVMSYGQTQNTVTKLEEAELRLEAKVDLVDQRLARVEGYLIAQENGYYGILK